MSTRQIFYTLLIMLFSHFAHAIDMKDILNISSIDLNSLNIEQLITDQSVVTNAPEKCSAVVYVLYGSAKKDLAIEEAKLISYTDRILPKPTIRNSKHFLMESFCTHTNRSTKALALASLAFAFPSDKETGEWLSNRYFFSQCTIEEKEAIVGAVKIGSYHIPETNLILKDALLGVNSGSVIGAALCIKNKPERYADFLPDLVASLLSLEERNKSYKNFATTRNLSVCYLTLTQALSEFEADEITPYLPFLQELKTHSGNKYISHLILKIERQK